MTGYLAIVQTLDAFAAGDDGVVEQLPPIPVNVEASYISRLFEAAQQAQTRRLTDWTTRLQRELLTARGDHDLERVLIDARLRLHPMQRLAESPVWIEPIGSALREVFDKVLAGARDVMSDISEQFRRDGLTEMAGAVQRVPFTSEAVRQAKGGAAATGKLAAVPVIEADPMPAARTVLI